MTVRANSRAVLGDPHRVPEIAKVDGNASRVVVFTRDPRFTRNPQAIARAKAIYNGTYQPGPTIFSSLANWTGDDWPKRSCP